MFVLIVTLGLEPLSGREGELLASVSQGSWLTSGSPLYVLILRAVDALGPPADVLLRCLSLVALIAGGALGGRLSLALGGTRRTALLVSTFLMTHGAMLLAAARFVPASLIWTLEALLVLLVLDERREGPRRWRRSALVLAGVALVGLEPVAALLLPVLAVWADRRGTRGIIAPLLGVAALGAALLVVWARARWAEGVITLPDPLLLVRMVVAAGPLEGFSEPAHPLHVITGPALTLALLGLGATGWIRGGWPLRVIGLGLALPGAVALFLAREELWAGSTVAVLIPPVVLLGAFRIESIRPGPDRTTWLVVLLGLCGLTGLRVIASYDHLETRTAAAALEPDEHTRVTDGGLARAIDFYRPERPRPEQGAQRPVRIWRPGDRSPRLVAVHAHGRPLGRLHIVRPGAPRYDFMEQLPRARVTYREEGQTFECPWHRTKQRFFCGGPEYQHVVRSSSTFDGVQAEAIYIHPLDDGVLELRWDDVPLDGRLVGVAGLDDGSLSFSAEPVAMVVRAGDAPPLRLSRGRERGLLPFEVDLAGGPARGSVDFRVTTGDDRGRHFFLDALIVDRGDEQR